ncbi:hypothetical protein F0L68_34110 [Solihabitans fulvus]|uniref:Uncharacterized protein n=1 Tax=Solihabitans fulvus TaxID=1892852 RepID=A0A5B2WP66_9PSEU|nr:hypothetical protein [Solihabitans fulvus]KAA2252804.1 hypothetical protein F0L68_34110 [Solihabitans fulvus]
MFYPAWDPDGNGPWDLEPCSLPWVKGDHYQVVARLENTADAARCEAVAGWRAGDVTASLPARGSDPASLLCLTPNR